MPLICISVLLTLRLRSCNTLIIDGDVESNQALLMLLKKQYAALIIRVIDDLVIQQVSNLHAILCMHYACHKLGQWVSGID